jgi:hypothetical protein
MALYAAASGEGDAGAMADVAESLPGATYLDRSVAELAAAVQAGGRGDGDAARARLTAARALVGDTDDRVARAVVELVAATVSGWLGWPEAEDVERDAQQLVAALAIDPVGWRQILALAHPGVPA